MPIAVADSFQKTPWVPFLSVVLLSFFLVVSFVNLSVLGENSPPEAPLVFSSLAEEDVQGSLFNIVEQLKTRLSRLCCAPI